MQTPARSLTQLCLIGCAALGFTGNALAQAPTAVEPRAAPEAAPEAAPVAPAIEPAAPAPVSAPAPETPAASPGPSLPAPPAPAAVDSLPVNPAPAPAPAPAYVPAQAVPAEAGPADEPDSKDVIPSIEPQARVMMGAELRRDAPEQGQLDLDSRQPFFLKHARVGIEARPHEVIELELSADIDAEPTIRDAFADLSFDRLLKVRAGHFKRPFGRTAFTGIGKLPFDDRGLFDRALIERAGWGDRSLGAMLHGRVKKKLRYYLGFTNSAPSIDTTLASQIRGVDVLGRVEYRPIKPLTVSVNGGHKRTEAFPDGPNLGLYAIGGDVELEIDAFELIVECNAVQNPYPPVPPAPALGDTRTPWAVGGLSYATYDIPLGGDFVLQPLLLGELLDTDTELSEDETLRAVVGVNLYFTEHVRLLPQVELVRPLGEVSTRSEVKRERYSLVLSVEL